MIDVLEHLDTNQPFVLFINLVLCAFIMGIAVCRLNAMDKTVLFRVQFEYMCYMATAFVSISRPWWGENVGWASLMLEGSTLIGFMASSHAWRPIRTREGIIDTPPETAKEDHLVMETVL